jgi:hypothetical protein
METSIKELVKETSRDYQVYIWSTPQYFCGTLLGWDIDIIPFGDSTKQVINAVGRQKTETKAYLAGVEYVRKHYEKHE